MATSRTIERTVGTARGPGGSPRRRLGVVMVVTLLVQALLGVANELFTTVPESGDPFTGAVPEWLLVLHVLVGTAAVVLAVVLVVSAWRARDRAWTGPASVGLVTVLAAWVSGHFFLETYGADALSLSMAAFGLASVAVYVVGLLRSASAS